MLPCVSCSASCHVRQRRIVQKTGDETADVVVVGAGVSGETAALELKAQNPNIKVVLLEKQATTGGSLRYSSYYIGTSSKLSRKSLNTNTVDDDIFDFVEKQLKEKQASGHSHLPPF